MSRFKERVIFALGAALAGLLYWWLLTYFWGHWVGVNPIAGALVQPGNVNPHYRWVLYPTDWLTSVIVSLPFAVLLIRFARQHLWLCVAAASVSCLFQVSWPGVLQPPAFFWAFIRSLLLQFTFLPASVALVLLARRGFAPNNSAKPKPLRGSS